MDNKHYGAGYLVDTGDFLKQLKIHSYTPFANLQQGVILDLGCGTGMDAINIADMVGERGQVIGIDHDQAMIGHARTTVGERKNIDFVQAGVDKLDFEDNGVSGIRMERVVQHLPEPDATFREVYRVLKTDHPFVVVETIWDSLNFYTQHIATEQKIRNYLTGQKVNNGWAGNKLTADLKANGFRNIQLDTFCMVVRTKEEANRYVFLDLILAEMVDKSVLTKEESEDFINSLLSADNNGYFTVSMNLVIAKAVK
ncbi:methyltransferase domain-containing protein [Sphingobacterium spiritivorum]|uniref:methyltransferase domain-containing protein n=1 Tax=Sphingobacterium spiritivorum TaxID=258 RepID=UPI003DA2F036